MIRFAVVGDAGAILRVGHCAPELAHLQGDTVILLNDGEVVADTTHSWNGSAFVPLPQPPAPPPE